MRHLGRRRRPERGRRLRASASQAALTGDQAVDPDVAGPVRPDLRCSAGQQPLRLLVKTTGAGPDPVRTPQGADLPAGSRYLPEDYIGTVQETMRALATGGSNAVGGLSRHAQTVVSQHWVKPNRRIFDNKVSRSPAPSSQPLRRSPHDLGKAKAKLYDPGAQALPGGVLSRPPNTASPLA